MVLNFKCKECSSVFTIILTTDINDLMVDCYNVSEWLNNHINCEIELEDPKIDIIYLTPKISIEAKQLKDMNNLEKMKFFIDVYYELKDI